MYSEAENVPEGRIVSKKGQSLASIGVVLPRTAQHSSIRQSSALQRSSLQASESGGGVIAEGGSVDAIKKKVTLEAYEVYGGNSPFQKKKRTSYMQRRAKRMTDMQSVSFSLTGRSSENEWAAQEGEARKESDDPDVSKEHKEGESPESEKRRKGKRKKTS